MNESPFISVFDALPDWLKQPRPLPCGCPEKAEPSIAVKESARDEWRVYCVCAVCAMTERRDVRQ